MVRVNYKAASTALNDLIAGQVQLTFGAVAAVTPHIKSGRSRALAVTSIAPSALAPGLPTLAASLPAYGEVAAVRGMFAPAKTPEAIINRLNEEIVRVLCRTDIKESFFSSGVEAVGSSPQEFTAKIKSEMLKWGKVVADAGVRDE